MSNELKEIEACIPALRRYAAAWLCDPRQGDDLVRESLVRALDRLHRRQAGEDLRVWLFSIMHRLLDPRMRKANVSGFSEQMELVGPGHAGQATEQEISAPRPDLLRALSGLSAEECSALLLVVLEDFPYADASRITGMPVSTVISHLSSARDSIRNAVDGTEVTPLRRVK